MTFEPRIVGILCNWCSYAGADLAGISRIQYPPNLRVVRVMCSGRVDPKLVLEALLAGADGVHLGQDDLAPEQIPVDARARLLVGLSTHTLAQVRESRARPVDYIAFGPVFTTSTKAGAFAARGLSLLREAVALAGRPVVAIGGISAATAPDVRATGAVAAAVISAIADASDPAEATRYLQTLLLATPPGRN